MRTVDATLTAALAAGKGRPILTGYIGYSNGSVKHSGPVLAYKLTGQTLEFKMAYTGDFASDQTHMWLERGVSIAGTDYTLTTGRFRILEQQYLEDGTQLCSGALFPAQYYSAPGDTTYELVISTLCSAFGKTAIFKSYTQAWLGYQFMADGEVIEVTDANKVLALLQQKRLITLCDNGDEEVLVYCADIMGSVDVTLYPTHDFKIINTKMRSRQYVWIDEAGTYHQSGTTSNPIHNLGYLESTDSAPARKTWAYEIEHVTLPDLRLIDGDVIRLSLYGGTKLVSFFAQMVEEFDPRSKGIPSWRCRIHANPIFHETAGGDGIPAALRIGNYQPLTTSRFKGLLTSNEVDVQAAFDKISTTAREVLRANRTYYVATTGDDANDGLSAGSPFLTVQHAVDVAAALDSSIYDVTIQLADGTYTGGIIAKTMMGSGSIYIKGNAGTPANVVLTYSTGNYNLSVDGVLTKYFLQDCDLQGNGFYSLVAANKAYLGFSNVIFTGPFSWKHINISYDAIVWVYGNYTIACGGFYHIECTLGGEILQTGRTVTLTGTPAFSQSFINALTSAKAQITGGSYSGAATGKRYNVALNAVINTNGAGANYFPGNAAGTTATGGQYA